MTCKITPIKMLTLNTEEMGQWFGFKYPQGSSQLSLTPGSGDPTPSSGLPGHQVHTRWIYIHGRQNTPTNEMNLQKKILNFYYKN